MGRKTAAQELFENSNIKYKPKPELIEVKSKRVQLIMQPSVYNAAQKHCALNYISFNEYIHQLIRKDLNIDEK